MYAIMSGGALVALCDKPRYVRRNPSSGAFIESPKEEAEAIAVRGKLYNLPGSDAIAGAPEAVAVEREVPEFVFSAQEKMEESTRAVLDELTNTQLALCDVYEAQYAAAGGDTVG